jgi:hypothetical protein
MDITTSELSAALRRVMQDYETLFSDSDRPTTNDLADKTGSAPTTIRTIKNNSIKSLSFKKSLDISKKLNGPTSLEDLVNYNLPTSTDKTDKLDHIEPYTALSTNFESLFDDTIVAKILILSYSNKNITRSFIKLHWGLEGIKKLDQLIEGGHLVEDNNKIMGLADGGLLSTKSAQKLISMGVSEFSFQRREMKKNWITFQSSNVNDKFIALWVEQLRSLFKKFNELAELEEYQGDTQMFMGLIFDSIIEDKGEVLQ